MNLQCEETVLITSSKRMLSSLGFMLPMVHTLASSSLGSSVRPESIFHHYHYGLVFVTGVISLPRWLTLVVNLLGLECTLQGTCEGVSTDHGCEQHPRHRLGVETQLEGGREKVRERENYRPLLPSWRAGVLHSTASHPSLQNLCNCEQNLSCSHNLIPGCALAMRKRD